MVQIYRQRRIFIVCRGRKNDDARCEGKNILQKETDKKKSNNMTNKTLTITLYTSELTYDIHNKTFLTGRSRLAENNNEQVAHMQSNDDEENINQIVRSVGSAFSLLKSKLSEYMSETETSSSNMLINKDSNLSLILKMPSNYNLSTREAIASACHQYIVNTSVADWFVITNKEDAKEYYAFAANNLATIREAINKRIRPERPSIS